LGNVADNPAGAASAAQAPLALKNSKEETAKPRGKDKDSFPGEA
jgi:hypothetical protein